jgi:hypothetical protein
VAASDRIFGRVMDLLEPGEGDRPQIQVMMSDHGEMLEDYPGMVGHGRYHHEPAIRIPLMIRLSWESEHRLIEEPVQLIDVYPTLMDLSRLEPVTELKGRSLAAAVLRGESPEASRDLVVETNKHKAKITSLVRNDLKYNYTTHSVPLKRKLDSQARRAGDEELSRLGEAGTEEIERARGAEAEPFRETLFRYLQSVDGRFIVRVSNPGPEDRIVKGRFEVTAPPRDVYISHGLIRDWSLEKGDVLATETGSDRVELELSLPAGDVDYLVVLHPEEGLRLHLFDEDDRPLTAETIAVGPGAGTPVPSPIDFASLTAEAATSEEEPLGGDGFGVRIWRTTGFVPFSVEPSELDEERVERLKALGYLQ